MWIAAVSDAHGDTHTLARLLMNMPPVDALCFLGDCATDGVFLQKGLARCQPHAAFYAVAGNNDGASSPVREQVLRFPHGTVLLTHGHAYRVKVTYDLLACHARELGATFALFGHTHQAHVAWHDSVLLINPGTTSGSLSGGKPTYARIEWTDTGILPQILRI